ncbi:MAG: hypothetical protein EBV34_17170 [Betaproteobacteria bacterium]|nr:hypothetical protein [Betaproteobacteria bacterium]
MLRDTNKEMSCALQKVLIGRGSGMNESGLPGYELVAWYAFFAPEGTPPDVVQKLSVSVSRITASAEFLATLARLGLDPMADNARDFAAKLPAENARWQKIVTLANAKGD